MTLSSFLPPQQDMALEQYLATSNHNNFIFLRYIGRVSLGDAQSKLLLSFQKDTEMGREKILQSLRTHSSVIALIFMLNCDKWSSTIHFTWRLFQIIWKQLVWGFLRLEVPKGIQTLGKSHLLPLHPAKPYMSCFCQIIKVLCLFNGWGRSRNLLQVLPSLITHLSTG